jgi:type I restriction enzyme, S subunit
MSFETETLESLCELVVDCPHSTPKWTDEGVIVLRNQNIKNGVLDLSAPSYTNEDDYQKRIKRAAPQAGDIVFTREAPMGDVCLIPKRLKCCLGQRQVLLRPKKSINGEYLFWALQSPYVQQQIAWNEGTGSTVSNVRIPVLKALNIPRIDGEDDVAKTLSDIASKIKLNVETNQTLEEMAQAIFKSWFVDFEPVKAKMNGEQPEGMDAATASLFPEKLVESELGLIPEGWDAGTVGSVTAAKGGYAFKSKQFVDEGNPVIKIKNITSAGTVTTSDCQCVDDDIAKTASRFKLSDGDLLMAMTGATVGKSGIYVSDGRDGYLNQRVARFESKVDSTQPCWFTYNLVNKDSIFEQIVGAAQGSAQPNISSKGIEQVKTVIPTFDLISKYQELVAPLYAKWISNFRENSQLSELRDTLLPKLLSGEIELGSVATE